MAKPLSPKSALIRAAIQANPGMQNKPLAELINGSDARKQDKITVTPADVAEQKQKLKKAGALPKATGKKRGRPKGSGKPKAAAPEASVTAGAAKPRGGGPVDLIDGVFALADECGGFEQLRRLVDRLAGVPPAQRST